MLGERKIGSERQRNLQWERGIQGRYAGGGRHSDDTAGREKDREESEDHIIVCVRVVQSEQEQEERERERERD